MSAGSLCVKFFAVTAVALAAPWLWAHDGLDGALPRASHRSRVNLSAPFVQTLAIADFDNDHKLDGAVLLDSGRTWGQNSFRIQFHLSGSSNTDLSFESTEPQLAIRALDINHDGATDVVVEHPFTHKRLYVWLNNGHGVFHKGRVEDFPSDEVPGGKRLESPFVRILCLAVYLPQQRGTEKTILAASFLRARPPSVIGFKRLSPAPSAVLRPFPSASSRAPPSIFL